MLDTSARLLRLLSLLQARRSWSGAELAERLEVTERTVRRDVDRLRSLGYPVQSTSGLAGGYQLGAGATLPPLLLEDDEALAVALGLRMAVTGTVAGMEESAVRALAKLEQVLPSRLRKRVRALHAAVAHLHPAGPRVSSERLTALADAWRSDEQVSFRYQDGGGRSSERTVEPHGLVYTGWRWYLLGWDSDRQDWRTFRVDRISSDIRAGRRFAPRHVPGGDVSAYVARSVTTQPYSIVARIVLHAPIERMAERVPPSAARLERIDDHRCLLEAGAHSLDVLAYHIGLLGVEFEVHEPPALADHLQQLADRLARAAARPTANRGGR